MLAYYLVIVGVAMLVFATAQLITQLRRKRRMRITSGRIIEWRQRADVLAEKRQLNTFYYYKVVQFDDAIGREVIFESNIGHATPRQQVGEVVRVAYDPANSAIACEDSGLAYWGFASGLALLGVLSVGSGLTLLN